MTDLDKAVERLTAALEPDGFLMTDVWRADLRTLLTALSAKDAELAKAREALRRARADMEGWAAYADEYFREKHDLAGDLAVIDEALGKTK